MNEYKNNNDINNKHKYSSEIIYQEDSNNKNTLSRVIPIILVLAKIISLNICFYLYFTKAVSEFFINEKLDLFDYFRYFLSLIFYFLSLSMLFYYTLSITTSPGYLDDLGISHNVESFSYYLNEKFQLEKLNDIDIPYCKKCNKHRPFRAHHCSKCNKCILKMDHHCPWINNCVGLKNQKFYFLFLFFAFSTISLAIVCLLTLPANSRKDYCKNIYHPAEDLNINTIEIQALKPVIRRNNKAQKDLSRNYFISKKSLKAQNLFDIFRYQQNKQNCFLLNKNKKGFFYLDSDIMEKSENLRIMHIIISKKIFMNKRTAFIGINIYISIIGFLFTGILLFHQYNLITNNVTSLEKEKLFSKFHSPYFLDDKLLLFRSVMGMESVLEWFLPIFSSNLINNGVNFYIKKDN